VSEELEHSLQQAIESYLGKRLAAIDEQLSRLQNDFGEALKGLRESSAAESLDASPLSAAIFAHLQAARAQKLSGAAPEPSQSSDEIATLKRAVEEIERQLKHADILGSLLTAAAQFAERAALFVIRNEQAIGWRECEAGDPTNLEMIGGVSLPLSAETLLGRAARAQQSWTGAPGSNSEDRLLVDQLGGDPQIVAAVPLVVRGKVVAVLYADSTSSEANALNVDALELLARVAAMAVNLASAPRAVVAEKPSEAEAVAPSPVVETATAVEAAPVQPEPVYTPEIEPQPIAAVPQPVAEEVSFEAEAEDVRDEIVAAPRDESPVTAEAESAAEETTPSEEVSIKTEPEVVAEEPAEAESLATAPTIETVPVATPSLPAPAFASQYAAPLGGARRYGVSEPELPIEVGEEERRLHNDARRFARLLVSEIKLYNEPKVKEGRSRGDIYDRLREDIDRSRQMYDKRVAPPVAARHDYFHQELVNTLAEGDPAKLGVSYPGASLATI
jgi:hypothetical protein